MVKNNRRQCRGLKDWGGDLLLFNKLISPGFFGLPRADFLRLFFGVAYPV